MRPTRASFYCLRNPAEVGKIRRWLGFCAPGAATPSGQCQKGATRPSFIRNEWLKVGATPPEETLTWQSVRLKGRTRCVVERRALVQGCVELGCVGSVPDKKFCIWPSQLRSGAANGGIGGSCGGSGHVGTGCGAVAQACKKSVTLNTVTSFFMAGLP